MSERLPVHAPTADHDAHPADAHISRPAALEAKAADGSATRRREGRVFAARILNYLTNYVIAAIPSFTVRRLWLEHVLGIEWGEGAAIHLHCFIWAYTPRQVRLAKVRFGRHAYINRGCTIDLRGGLTIGDNASISPDVTILTAAHDMNDPTFPDKYEAVTIEDHVWVGTRAMILPGVTLGRGCVVAAGSVVTRDVAPLDVVAGVPARRIGVRDADATHYELIGRLPLFE